MKGTLFGIVLLVAVGGSSKLIAQGTQLACGERTAIVDRLAAKWGESFGGGGMQSASSILEVWFSAEKGTWTILRTDAYGNACVMATGTNWRAVMPNDHVAGIEG